MKSYSKEKQSDFEVRGPRAYIRWDHTEETKTDFDGESTTQWVCEEIAVDKHISRYSLIETIIRTQYPDYGSEIAAINNGGEEYTVYQAFRERSKSIADGYIEYLFNKNNLVTQKVQIQ